MRTKKLWTKEEQEMLCDMWGEFTVPQIAKKLRRTQIAVKVKAKRLKLGSLRSNTEYLTIHEISKILNISEKSIKEYWVYKYGLKGRKKALNGEREFWCIKHSDLMNWLENNPDKWNAAKVEEYTLGYEPNWLREKRKKDIDIPVNRFALWTPKEDHLLKNYINLGFKQREIAERLGRSINSIEKRKHRIKNQKGGGLNG